MYLCTRLILPITAAQLLCKHSPALFPAWSRMSGSREEGCSSAPHATHLATSNTCPLPVLGADYSTCGGNGRPGHTGKPGAKPLWAAMPHLAPQSHPAPSKASGQHVAETRLWASLVGKESNRPPSPLQARSVCVLKLVTTRSCYIFRGMS